jgi:PAS domain S-box-containing protein
MVVESFLLPGRIIRWSGITVAVGVACIGALMLNRRGRVRTGSILLLTVTWIAASASAWSAGGIAAPAMTTYLCLILIAGLLLGYRASIATGIVCALSGLALVLFDAAGKLPAVPFVNTRWSLWCINIMFITIVIAVQRLAVRSVSQALQRARSELAERKEAEVALRKSEEKFSKAFRASPDGLAISELETGRYIDVNEGYCRLYGHTREQMLGRTSLELGIWDNPREREFMVAALKTEGSVRNLEVRTRTRAGELRLILLSAESIDVAGQSCLVSVLHDMTDRVRAEQALRYSEESLRATIENTPNVAVQWYDREGRITFWNQASEALYGWTPTEARGKTLDDLSLEANETPLFLKALKTIERTDEAVGPIEFKFRRRDGTFGTCLSTIFRIVLPSGEPRFVCMDVDLTERKAAEESLHQAQTRELQAHEEFARRLLTAQERERKRLAAELHDSLGQNLSIIKNRADFALQISGLPSNTSNHLEGIRRAAVEAIAETRNLAHNLRPPHIEQIGLTESLRGLLIEVSKSSTIHFEQRLEKVDDVFQEEAATSVYRILQEALNNLVKHSQAHQVIVTLERDVRSVRLRIADDGIGFDSQHARSRGGLGLSSINERARMLGGSLKLESASGKGTELIIDLPITGDSL